jgi:hypothetical protein
MGNYARADGVTRVFMGRGCVAVDLGDLGIMHLGRAPLKGERSVRENAQATLHFDTHDGLAFGFSIKPQVGASLDFERVD